MSINHICDRYECWQIARFRCTYDRRRTGRPRWSRDTTTTFSRYLCATHSDWLERDGNVSNIRRVKLL
jgi:hypothetical protein